MQDFDVSVDDDNNFDSSQGERLQRAKAISRLVLKRVLMVVFFGPGVLGFLWLIGKLFKH